MGNKADLLTLRLMCNRQVIFLCHASRLILAETPKRKQNMRQRLLIQMIEHIGLILCRVPPLAQAIYAIRPAVNARIVSRRNILCIELLSLTKEFSEFDIVIADDTGIRRAPTLVFIEKAVLA